MRLRAQAKDSFAAREGVKLSPMPFFVKAAAQALKAHPVVNARINEDEGTITYFDAENIGIAVDSEKGLMTPVIKDAGDLNIAGIAKTTAELAGKVRANKITPDELSGATFTISNTGSRGALFDTIIVPPGQVAILGIGATVKRPAVIETGGGHGHRRPRHDVPDALLRPPAGRRRRRGPLPDGGQGDPGGGRVRGRARPVASSGCSVRRPRPGFFRAGRGASRPRGVAPPTLAPGAAPQLRCRRFAPRPPRGPSGWGRVSLVSPASKRARALHPGSGPALLSKRRSPGPIAPQGALMTAPVVHSLREQIREHIVEGIVSGRWKPGERIVERRIATELEVSQTPVREALRELESLRLIESAPNKGVRVRNLTAADLEESYPVRAGLEAIAAELAAERLAEDCSALEPHVAALYEADRASDGTGQVRHTVAFHRELVRAAGNSRAAAHLGGPGHRGVHGAVDPLAGDGAAVVRGGARGAGRGVQAAGPADRGAGEGACAGLRAPGLSAKRGMAAGRAPEA